MCKKFLNYINSIKDWLLKNNYSISTIYPSEDCQDITGMSLNFIEIAQPSRMSIKKIRITFKEDETVMILPYLDRTLTSDIYREDYIYDLKEDLEDVLKDSRELEFLYTSTLIKMEMSHD